MERITVESIPIVVGREEGRRLYRMPHFSLSANPLITMAK